MKKLLMFVLLISVLAACNNDNKNRGLVGGGDDGEGGWNSKVRNKYLKECVDGGVTKQMCSCILEKIEKKYSVSELEDLSEEDGEELGRKYATQCLGTKGGDDDEDDFGTRKKTDDDEDFGGGGGGRWTTQQRNQYISECAGAAKSGLGYTSQQANSFCDCMTRKVEKKFSYKEAQGMTAQDFSTQEWEDARTDCKSNGDY